jgi:hypothetical protein
MTHDLRTARDRIRAKAHRALAAKRRRRAAIRGGLALSIVAAVGLTAWRLPAPPTPTPVETPDSGALSVQIVAFDPEPIERISDDDLARILRTAGSPYGLIVTDTGARVIPNRQQGL